jgi:hypothetical protein
MRIVYTREDGGLAVVYPVDTVGTDVDSLAQDVVPTGLKYKIVEDSEIPDDRTFRNAWEIAESELTDGVGA